MIKNLNLKKPYISILKFITIEKYCPKNINMTPKAQNLILMELKICKKDFMSKIGASKVKERWNFYEFGYRLNLMELFGIIVSL